MTISELAEKADIPNSTCRRYLATFENFFEVKGGNRLKKYKAEAVDVLKRIKDLYDNGMDTTEIHSVLANEFPMIVTVSFEEDGEPKEKNENLPSLATSEQILEILERLDKQEEIIGRLVEKLAKKDQYWEEKFAVFSQDVEMITNFKRSMEQRRLDSSKENDEIKVEISSVKEQNNQMVKELQNIQEKLSNVQDQGIQKELLEKIADIKKALSEVAATKKRKKFLGIF